MRKRLIIVSNRLPYNLNIENGELHFHESDGGLASGLRSYLDSKQIDSASWDEYLWVGWPGVTVPPELREEVTLKSAEKHHACPVFFSEEEMEKFYHGFCNKTIWPLFHYFTSLTVYDREFWNSYRHVNEIFCERLLDILKEGDMVWIHDYQLMLLPKLLKERTSNIPIGFFLHIPFPSFELFRLLPNTWRHELLEGILGANLIGFHTFDYTQHFLQCVLRILGHEHYMGEIFLPDITVKVDTFPMGINFDKFSTALEGRETQEEYARIKKTLAGFKLILSIDRLDYTKGILNRLQAFETLLKSNPEFCKKVVLVMVMVPSRIKVEHYEQMKKQIEELIGKINGQFGEVDWTPILYQYKSLSFSAIAALYNASDVALVTPLRDGMNLVAKEYVASQAGKKGVLILSEMAGAAKELGESIVINPNNTDEIALAMKDALEMPMEEQVRRNIIMQKRLRRYNVIRWATDFIMQLTSLSEKQVTISSKVLSQAGIEKLTNAYRKSSNRLILLDYDGTLAPLTRHPNLAKPGERVINLLHNLANDVQNTIVLISGRDRKTLQDWLGALPINFVAEHGTWMKEKNEAWKTLQEQSSVWKSRIVPILEQYTDRLPGAHMEEKEFSLCWHYRTADPEQSQLLARELADLLVNYTANINLQVLQGNKVIEIRNTGTDKGTAALFWLSKYDVDFILAIGDDVTDENIFLRLPEWAHTLRVGTTKTHAKYTIKDSFEVVKMLESLRKNSKQVPESA